jgi:hypothetical protein
MFAHRMFAGSRVGSVHDARMCGAVIRQCAAVTRQCGAARTGRRSMTAQAATPAVATATATATTRVSASAATSVR